MDSSLVSVVIPVYNYDQYLAAAIESVLSQTYSPIEIIVVDDGSTDRSSDIAQSFHQVQYLFQDNAGQASARNRGIRAARGEYIAFLDADDLWLPKKIALQIAAYKVDPELEIVTGHVQQFVSSEIEEDLENKLNLSTMSLPGFSSIAILVKYELFEKVGLFHEKEQIAETISWFARVTEHELKIKVLPDVVAMRRIHGNNYSTRCKQEKTKAITRILKLSIERRRAGI
ncbi:glycosyltransferase family 2 protein [bacterium]|nr:glycosyltransferase family 2 protein [bacterium]